MKITWKRALLGLFGIALIGVVVLVSGVVPIKASSGHWPATAWVLDFASDRSISFHSTGIKPQPMGDEASVTLGAATYRSNCQFCHGQPGRGRPPMANGMTPTPPLLADAVPKFDRSELFYILKHGIKFAGMPAWPTQKRDDEIWSVVDFLQQLPEMNQKEYFELVSPAMEDANASAAISQSEKATASETRWLVSQRCAACHAMDGNGRAGASVPKLAGQSETYLSESLRAYRSRERISGIMMPIAYELKDHQIDALAEYFSKQSLGAGPAEPPGDGVSSSANRIRKGDELANEGSKNGKIASCVDCHDPADEGDRGDYPRLAGQPVEYLVKQLELFARRARGGSDNASLMHPIADKLNDDQRQALAAYYSAAAVE